MTRRALIGHTGFVGSTLKREGGFTHLYRSTDIDEMRGQAFDEVVCAGAPAVKWLANKEPENDLASVSRLADVLATVEAERFLLVSTVDVYPDPASAPDETVEVAGLVNHAYGRHRSMLEERIRARFADHLVVRLPALFGRGLRKNVLFDLLRSNALEAVNPAGSFQWYPLARLSDDVGLLRAAGIRLANLAVEPVATLSIVERFFPDSAIGPEKLPAPSYDARTIHAGVFPEGRGGYVAGAERTLADIGAFVAEASADPDGMLGA